MTEPIELVTLLPGARRFRDDNKCQTWIASAMGQRHVMRIYLKALPPRPLFVECIAAQIGRCLGLPIPRPLLVSVDPARLPIASDGFPERKFENPSIFFGSEAADYPSLKHFVPINRAVEKLKLWPHALEAGCFDEWIINNDRHEGNILYGGGGDFLLIDHSHALSPEHVCSAPNQRNTMLDILADANVDELSRRRLQMQAKQKILSKYLEKMSQDWILLTSCDQYCPIEKAKHVVSFLSDRLPELSSLIANRLQRQKGNKYEAG